MKKYLAIILIVLCSAAASAQTYNNEWIDYAKTYYKFNVGSNGLYRIPYSILSSNGLGNVQSQDFQLWRNGVQVPIYTSVISGLFSSSDYIEFYGLMNDGSTDTKLYKYDSLQMNPHWSLYTDTSAYFLTVNTSSANVRFVDSVNNVAGNLLPVEPYFMYTLSNYFRQEMNQGYGYDLGQLVSSASYEQGEGWSSNNLGSGGKATTTNSAIQLYSSGPSASLSAVVAGNAYTSRTCNVNVNGTTVATSTINGYDIGRINAVNIPLSVLTSNAANIDIVNAVAPATDVIVAASCAITYPRKFNFSGQTQFEFELASTANGYYLKVSNFSYGNAIPILYDLTNDVRYTAVVDSGFVKIALPSSTVSRKFVLLSCDPSRVTAVNNLEQRNFINYGAPENQGDYLIISHPILFDDGAGNNYVESYRQYRSSVEGGSFNAKIIDINQLTDQFAFGVKHHPLSVRNFSYYAGNTFATVPKYFFLVGKGLNYISFRENEGDRNIGKQALIPTFGTPASDNLLMASRTGEYPLIPIGRLSAIAGSEVNNYLEKVKQYDLAQHSDSQTIPDKAWMKNVAEVAGGVNDPSLSGLIISYLQGYQGICSDTLFGANVYQFDANTGSKYATGTNISMDSLINGGVSLITYFGHSSPNNIEFSLDNPEGYNNNGKYPLIIINGCESGNLFEFDTLRAISKGTLSEKFIFTRHKGSIGYIASTSFGLPTQLNYVNSEFNRNFSQRMYGQSLGNILKTTMKNVITTYSTDYIAQTHVEEITLHGDPAIILNSPPRPDYIIVDSLLSFNPSVISVADAKVTVKAKVLNIGMAVNDSVRIKVQLMTPDSTVSTIYNAKIHAVKYKDSITIVLPLNPLVNKGLNYITVTVDPDNVISELSETNNSITKSFLVNENEIRPVFPYPYSIVNEATPVLYASTANPTADSAMYIMEFDTTALFNSAGKISSSIISKGGIIKFAPNITLADSTVYYWRVSIGPLDSNTIWSTSSFEHIIGTDTGYSQAHYFQFKNDDFSSLILDSSSRFFSFESSLKKLLTRNGDYPYYGWDQNNVNLDNTVVDIYGCVYNTLQFYVFDSATLKPWANFNVAPGKGRFGSSSVSCSGTATRNFFEYPLGNITSRKSAMNFFDSIPNGAVVLIRNLMVSSFTGGMIDAWKADTAVFGPGISLWHTFKKYGLTEIDSFTTPLPFVFTFKKGYPADPINQEVAPTLNTQVVNSFFVTGLQTAGTISSPWMGPAKAWKRFKWDEINPQASTIKSFDVIGKDALGNEVVLASVYNSKDTSISYINAKTFPYLKLRLHTKNEIQVIPTQLKYWMLTASLAPEGAVSPNIAYQFQDSLTLNDSLYFSVAFKNISKSRFDSLKVRLTVTDRNGLAHIYNNLQNGQKIVPLLQNDTAIVSYIIPAGNYYGKNQFYLDINPDNDQPEQYHFNNVLYRNFFVKFPSVCPNGFVNIFSGKYNAGNTYQWQVNDGTGYTDLSDQGIYSGVNTDTLHISNAATSMCGYKYRCTITNNSNVSYSDEYTLRFLLKWTGASDNAWENPANWSCNQVPDMYTDVIIDSGLVNYPVVNSNAACKSITVKPFTSVTVNSNYDLKIAGTP